MTAPFNRERYQSDRLTFERQQFEESLIKAGNLDPRKDGYLFMKWKDTNTYMNETIASYWFGYKLAKGLL